MKPRGRQKERKEGRENGLMREKIWRGEKFLLSLMVSACKHPCIIIYLKRLKSQTKFPLKFGIYPLLPSYIYVTIVLLKLAYCKTNSFAFYITKGKERRLLDLQSIIFLAYHTILFTSSYHAKGFPVFLWLPFGFFVKKGAWKEIDNMMILYPPCNFIFFGFIS